MSENPDVIGELNNSLSKLGKRENVKKERI